MIDGNGYEWTDQRGEYIKMEDPYGNFVNGKTGNGYARITLLEDPSQDNLIKEIQINKGTITPEVNFDDTEYKIELSSEDTELTIYGVVNDIKATIEGNGTYDILPGENIITLKVTAESEDVREYKIIATRPASSNSKPANITIDGLIESIININPEKYGKLQPEQFDPDIHEYSMVVPSRLKKLTFNVEKGHKYQTVEGDGQVTLNAGENEIVIKITSEDKTKVDTYTYHIERDMSGNCMLEILSVTNVEKDIEFDQDILEYYMIVPNEIDHLDITAIPEVKTLEPIIIGNKELKVGLNDVYVIINAENGEQLVYIIHAYRMMSGNTFISELKVYNGENELLFTPEYNKILDSYTLDVPNEVDKINIIAKPEVSTTKIEGAGEKALQTGINVFVITATAQDGSKDTYTITIKREKSNNNYLANLSTSEAVFVEEFNKNTLEYHTQIEASVNYLNINYETEVDTSKVQILNNNNFSAGENTVTIRVTAENGEVREYKIIADRKKSENNYLKSLSTNYGTLQPSFDKETNKYTLEVENEVSIIDITAVKEDLLSTIAGNGKYALEVGENNVTITVIAESGAIRTYEIDITRKQNSNKNLLRIENDKDVKVTKENDNTYKIEVTNDTKQITITGIPEVNTSTVTGNGKKTLQVGENTYILTVEAQDGTTKNYNVIITRAKSNNANLKTLFIEESTYTPKLDNEITTYYTRVLQGVNNLTMQIETQDEGASYEVIGNNNFINGENEVIIKVTASDETTKKEYKIKVLKQEENTGSNYLYILTVNKGTLSPSFTKENQVYEVILPYEASDIYVDAITQDALATLNGTGSYNLEVGLNVIPVTVTSTDGIERTYQIKVTREESTETRLKTLEVKQTNYTPEFNMDNTTYYLETSNSSLEIFAETYDSKASYEIIGNENFVKGTNNVIIRVTAQNGVNTKDYNLVVTRTLSYNNNLKSLVVEGYELEPQFNKATLVYEVNVGADVNKVNITGEPEESYSTVSGTGVISINSGRNVIPITVTSEAGTTKTYTVIVNKDKSDNNYLEALVPSEGILTPKFDKETLEYDIEVEYDIDNIFILAYPEDNLATVTGSGKVDLKVGNNEVNISVISEKGNERTYKINVLRKPAISALLKNLEVKNYTINPIFNMDTKSYYVVVDNEITSLDLIIETLDPKATYEVEGNENLQVGMNEIKIKVLSSDKLTQETYYINVNRQIYSNNYLSYILPSKGKLEPSFEKTTNNYNLILEDDVESVYIDAEPEDKNSTVEGVATYTITKGENKVELVVTSSLGIKRTYTINVIRKKNSNNYLSKLEVKNGSEVLSISPIFNKETLEYEVSVPEGTSRIQILSEVEKSLSEVSGNGYKTVRAGENVYNIVVTAENGSTRTYKVKVNRPKSNNNNLIELVPSVGVLSPNFNYSETEYTLVVGNTDAILSFEVNTENRYALVTGIEEKVIPDGESLRTIVVTAEDGSTKAYNVKVIKNRTDDARLKNLEVAGYTFNETFNEDKYIYTINVPNEVTSFEASRVTAIPKYETSTVYLDNDLTLSTNSENSFDIKVLAQDGYTAQIYKIKVIRAKNDNNYLSSLSVKTGVQEHILTPEFNKEELKYEINLPVGTTNVQIAATVENSLSTITGIGSKTIVLGENEYNIVVTAENGSTRTYTLKLNREANKNTFLESLIPSIGTLSPEFNKNILEYTVEVGNEDYYISFNAQLEDPLSTISGTEETYIEDGENIRKITVTAENESTKTYTVKVIKNRTNDPRLKSLAVKSFTLDQEFKEDLFEYTLTVPNDKFEISENEIVAKPKYEGSTLEYTPRMELSVLHVNEYQIKVTSPDKTKEATYKIHITREKSSDSTLKNLSVTGYKIKEEFDKDIHTYTVLVPKGTKVLEAQRIVPMPTDQYATIVRSENDLNIENGEKTYTIDVTSHDETTTTQYVLNVEFAKSDNAYLKELTIDKGELSPEFDTNVTSYDIVIPYNENAFTVNAVPVDETAIVEEGNGTHTLTTQKTQILIKVKAENESYRIYILNVVRGEKEETTISGKIQTENVENKHIAIVELYKEEILLQRVNTKEDGTYEIYVKPETYSVKISKLGYLDYQVNNITIETLNDEVNLPEYNLVAGDVVETGEIEIDDLADLNDNFGVIITEENKLDKSIYDLNEDGVVNKLDRDILKKNYGKVSEIKEWINPNIKVKALKLNNKTDDVGNTSEGKEPSFTLPINCKYTITSEYGSRTDPITKKEASFHHGIDIAGTHHADILSVADGEVTYAGVQDVYGNCVEIKHVVNGETIYSFYAHLSQIDVKVGQTVAQGETIGLEGGAESDPNHGNSTGHHLHFEIRTSSCLNGNATRVNPRDYIEF